MDAGADEAPLVQVEDESGEKDLDAALRCLEGFLALLGFPDSSSRVRLAASWAAFLLLGVAVPSAAIGLYQCSHSVCAEYKVHQFELCVLLSQVLLAAVSLACISRNLLKYGIRRFLFVDQHHGHVERFQKEYVRKIQSATCVIEEDLEVTLLGKKRRSEGEDSRQVEEDLKGRSSMKGLDISKYSRLVEIGLRARSVVDIKTGRNVRFGPDATGSVGILLFGSTNTSLVSWIHLEFFHLLVRWILPCFIVMTVRETVHFMHTFHQSAWRSTAVLMASMLSWVYLTIILLSACLLFNLVCNLQIIHFEDYGKFLERDVETFLCLEEHMRLRFYLSKISHRFRIFLLLLFLVVTVSQFVTLFQTTGYSGNINFTNAGSLAVSSVVQVVVVVLCLNAASKISHRAQGISSLASRWHAYATCCPIGSQMRTANGSGNIEAVSASSFLRDYSESDLESLENVATYNNAQLTSFTSYHKRQALVIYLQSNPGGITIFGWTVDRTLLNTIFFLELTLVLFVLGKTIVFPSL
ncbi:hypothetical protein ZIOFF_018940 [Zingiber officinale]|uniref:Uncharacterized protein n=1 Tax=Zingiber officinale TaxID=94328 RepID=A0A8J5HQZ1_ZINOF|nr:hypothetical protein ZIOFF_018940 [Zingiber officinale]